MSTRFWIPFGIVVYLLAGPAMMYYEHNHYPMKIVNDTKNAANIAFAPENYITRDGFFEIARNEKISFHSCLQEKKYIYYFNSSDTNIIGYRGSSVCRKCPCELKISELEKHREDWAVPWQKTGVILGPDI